MRTFRYRGRVLTPVHVGTGETIDPLEYVVKDGKLVRFSSPAVIADLPPAERERLERMLASGQIKDLHVFFKNHVDPERHAVAVAEADPSVVREFETKCSNPANELKVRPMIRNAHAGRPYLPGSSVKGAIRTAVVSSIVNGEKKADFEQYLASQGQVDSDGAKARRLQETALGFTAQSLERDPFRLVKVADALLPAGCTRVDRVFNVKPSRQQDMPVDMWERVLCAAEGRPTEFTIEVSLDERAMQHPKTRQHLGRALSWEEIAGACNAFYFRRLTQEVKRFYSNPATGQPTRTGAAVYNLLATQTPEGKKKVAPPRAPDLLLRVGRFSHFESLSVDTFRQGWNARARRTISEGTTRNLASIHHKARRSDGTVVDDELRLPFGWILLELA
ncbi:MAG: type III-A CRISPR-associated RAMP protein Csm5 [Thermodesulfobacteriota bacterium]